MSSPKVLKNFSSILFPMYYILDDDGNPVRCINVLEWGKWMAKSKRVIARDFVNEAEISTVFLGLDHNALGHAPILYETMIFNGKYNGFTRRWENKDQALDGHIEIVDHIRNGDEP